MQVQSPQEIVKIYKAEKEREELGPNELCLFFYFATFYKQDISGIDEFAEIIEKILSRVKELSASSLMTLLWGLGIYKYESYEISMSEAQRYALGKEVVDKCENFPVSQLSSLGFASSQIFIGERDREGLLLPILTRFGRLAVKSLFSMGNPEIINFLLTFVQAGYREINIIGRFTDRLEEVRNELSVEDIDRIIIALSELGHRRGVENFVRFILMGSESNSRKFEENLMDVHLVSSLIFSLANASGKDTDEELRKKLIEAFLASNFKNINISEYVNVWLSLAKF